MMEINIPDVQTAIAATEVAANTVEKAKGFLSRLLGPAVDECALMMQESVRQYRFKNQIRVLTRSEEMLAEAGLKPNAVPLRALVPLLENASREDNKSLQEHWSALLANSSVSTSVAETAGSFSEILKQLSTLEALLLNAVYDSVLQRQTPFIGPLTVVAAMLCRFSYDDLGRFYVDATKSSIPWELTLADYQAPHEGIDQQQRAVALTSGNLVRLGLLWRRDEVDFARLSKHLARNHYFRSEHDFKEVYGLSAIGCEFVQACRPPQPAVPPQHVKVKKPSR